MKVKKSLESFNKNVRKWTLSNFLKIAFFNAILCFLVLLRSAGYFYPFFELTINIVVLCLLLLLIVLFRSTSKTMFVILVFFWLITAGFSLLRVGVWAERTAVYVFQSFILGMILNIFECITSKT